MHTLQPPSGRKVRVMSVKLSKDALDKIRGGGNIRVQFGSDPAFLVDAQSFPFSMTPEPSNPAYIYKSNATSTDFDYIAPVSHRCLLRKELSSTVKERLKSRTEAAERERVSRKVSILSDNDIKQMGTPGSKTKSKTSFLARSNPKPSTVRSAPVSPHIGPHHSTYTSSTSTAVISARSNEGVPLRKRLIQLLARGALTLAELRQMTKESEKDLELILSNIATRIHTKYTLKPEIFKEVRIYDWTLYTKRDKDEVIANAKNAFDKLGLSPDAPERIRLLPPISHSSLQNEIKGRVDTPSDSGHHERTSLGKRSDTSADVLAKDKATSKKKAPPSKDIMTNAPTHNNSRNTPVHYSTPSNTNHISPAKRSHSSSLSSSESNEIKRPRVNSPSPANIKSKDHTSDPKSRQHGKVTSPNGSKLSGTSNDHSTSNSKSFKQIQSLADFQGLHDYFNTRYKEYQQLDEKIKKHRHLVNTMQQKEVNGGMSDKSDSEVSRKPDRQGGDSGSEREGSEWQQVIQLAERYLELHEELGAIKQELWRAYNAGIQKA